MLRLTTTLLLLAACDTSGEPAPHDTADTASPDGGGDADADTDTDTDADADADTDTDTDTEPAAEGCPDFFPVDVQGISWTYQTTHSDGRVVTWTQAVYPESEGRAVLHTEIEGTASSLYYQCGEGGSVSALGGDTLSSEGSTTFTYSPAAEMWPGGEPAEGMSWSSEGAMSGTWQFGGQAGTFGGAYSMSWELTGSGLTYDLGGQTLTGCHSYRRAATTDSGSSTSTTTELGIYCGSLYGLVWTDVVTETSAAGYTDRAESFTQLIGASFP